MSEWRDDVIVARITERQLNDAAHMLQAFYDVLNACQSQLDRATSISAMTLAGIRMAELRKQEEMAVTLLKALGLEDLLGTTEYEEE